MKVNTKNPVFTQQKDAWTVTATEAVGELLRQGDTVRFRANGNSMFPLIPSGAIVIVRPFITTDAKPGAILLFPYGQRLLLHRLVGRKDRAETALFCGDMTQQGHENVALGEIIGTAIAAIQPDGKERKLSTTPVRWAGLLRYHARPLRRSLSRLSQGIRKTG